jgi:hypothetical protein
MVNSIGYTITATIVITIVAFIIYLSINPTYEPEHAPVETSHANTISSATPIENDKIF